MHEHIYEICLRWATLYAQPNVYSAHMRRLSRGTRFRGHAAQRGWIVRAGGGYVVGYAVRDLGESQVTNEDMTAAVDRFSAAYGGEPAATGDLLEALASTAQQLVTSAVAVLMERQDEQAKRQDLLQRHIEAIDARLDEVQAIRDRQEKHATRLNDLEARLNGVRHLAADVREQTDVQLDMLRKEQLEPTQRDELIGVLYQVSARTTDLEQRMATLEQRQSSNY